MAENIPAKAASYGIDSASIDGMDVLKVYDGMKPMVEECRETSRPAFVEIRTYRYKGHSMSDPRKYRTKQEEQRYEATDPIERLTKFLLTKRGFAQEDRDAMANDVRQEIREAIAWAEASPPPDLSELYTDVYADTWGPYPGTSPPQMYEE